MLLFTAIFGRENPIILDIGVVNQDGDEIADTFIEVLNSTNVTKIYLFNSPSEAESSVSSREIDAYIIIPSDFTERLFAGQNSHVDIYIDMSDPDISQITEGIIRQIISNFNDEIRERWMEYSSQYIPPQMIPYLYAFANPINASISPAEAGPEVGYKEYIISGMIGYGFLFSALATSTNVIVYEKEERTIKRLKLSLAKPWDVLIGKTIALFFNLYLYVGILIVIAYFLLRPQIYWNIPSLIFLSFVGGLSGIAIGLILSILSSSPEAANGAAISIAVFLQFFIGIYFPLEFLPEYLQAVSNIIPFTLIVNIMRENLLFNAPLSNHIASLAIVMLVNLALYVAGSIIYILRIQREEV
jgi:ABC-2 type transport system permease protein